MATDNPTASPVDLQPTSPEVKQYERSKLIASILALVLSLGAVGVAALFLGPLVDGTVRSVTGDNRWLRLPVLGLVYAVGLELLTLPFSFWSGFVLEHRYGLSRQSLGAWIWRQLKENLVGGLIGVILLYGLFAFLWFSGNWWWLWATAGWLAVSLILGQLFPVLILPLFYRVTPLDDPELRQRLERVAEGTGLTVEGVYRFNLSSETRKATAALAGLGRTRRVLLGDTLLQEFTPEEIEVVFAHEVGHHVHRHLIKIIVPGILAALAGFWLVDVILNWAAPRLGYGSFNDPAALPLILLVLGLLSLLLSPLQNGLSRHFERQSDRYALQRTGLTQAYRSAFIKLAQVNKSDPDPHPLVVWLFHDHPPIKQRLAMGEGPLGSHNPLMAS
jgi:STE24 endopeptidase